MNDTYTDANGNDWTIKVNAFSLDKVERSLEVSFSALPEDKEGPILRIATDCMFVFRVLWILCEDQAVSRNIDEEKFSEGLVGDALGKAQAALLEAIAKFHPSEDRREGIRKVFGIIKSAEAKLIQKANAGLDAINVDKLVQEVNDAGT
ncbi:MAG: hypothetical protein AAGC72_01140 [Planctomycetota bacterium]